MQAGLRHSPAPEGQAPEAGTLNRVSQLPDVPTGRPLDGLCWRNPVEDTPGRTVTPDGVAPRPPCRSHREKVRKRLNSALRVPHQHWRLCISHNLVSKNDIKRGSDLPSRSQALPLSPAAVERLCRSLCPHPHPQPSLQDCCNCVMPPAGGMSRRGCNLTALSFLTSVLRRSETSCPAWGWAQLSGKGPGPQCVPCTDTPRELHGGFRPPQHPSTETWSHRGVSSAGVAFSPSLLHTPLSMPGAGGCLTAPGDGGAPLGD